MVAKATKRRAKAMSRALRSRRKRRPRSLSAGGRCFDEGDHQGAHRGQGADDEGKPPAAVREAARVLAVQLHHHHQAADYSEKRACCKQRGHGGSQRAREVASLDRWQAVQLGLQDDDIEESAAQPGGSEDEMHEGDEDLHRRDLGPLARSRVGPS
jgi:hypothetical protein